MYLGWESFVFVGGEPGFVGDDGSGGCGGGGGGERERKGGGGGGGISGGFLAGEGGKSEEALHVDGEAEIDDDGFVVFALDHDVIFFEIVVDNADFLHPFDGEEDALVNLSEHAFFEVRGSAASVEGSEKVFEADAVDEPHLGDDIFVWTFSKVSEFRIHVLDFIVVGQFFLVSLDALLFFFDRCRQVFFDEFALLQFRMVLANGEQGGFFGVGGCDEHEVMGSRYVFLDEGGNPDVVFGILPSRMDFGGKFLGSARLFSCDSRMVHTSVRSLI